MMITAKLRYLHIAPRKVRLVADLIRGKTVEEAQTILNFTVKSANKPMLKLLKSAVANAKLIFKLKRAAFTYLKLLWTRGRLPRDGGPGPGAARLKFRRRPPTLLSRLMKLKEKEKKLKKLKDLKKSRR